MVSLRYCLSVVVALVAPLVGAEVERYEIPNAAQPQLAVGRDGRVWLAYGRTMMPQPSPGTPPAAGGHGAAHSPQGQGSGPSAVRSGEVFVTCSRDGGRTFQPAVVVAPVPGLALGLRRGPRIVADGDRITVTVVGQELLSFTSEDGGKTWSGPVVINEVPTSAREGLHDLARSPEGQVFVTWLDLRNGRMELWGATSNDAGHTWSKNERVYASPDKSICECCHPSACYDDKGNLAVMWRNSIEGYRDMWMALRPRGTDRFAAARKIGQGRWKLNACPMDGGRVFGLGGGQFGAVWQREGEVFLSRSADAPEVSLGSGRQPLAVARREGMTMVWQRGTDLMTQTQPGPTVLLAAQARFAVAVATSDAIVVAYEQGPAKEKQPGIVVQRL